MSIKLNQISEMKLSIHYAKYSNFNIGGYMIGQCINDVYCVSDILPIYHNNIIGPIIDLVNKFQDILQSDQMIIGFYYSNVSEEYIPRYANLLKKDLSVIAEIKNVDERLFLNVRIFLSYIQRYLYN